jgi:catechol 2,3-dioxygenase-like lactoylglutathione lyase family enzyme
MHGESDLNSPQCSEEVLEPLRTLLRIYDEVETQGSGSPMLQSDKTESSTSYIVAAEIKPRSKYPDEEIRLKAKLDHIGIVVEKLDKEILDFYQEVLGCLKPKHFHVKTADEEINYVYLPLPRGNNYVELLCPVRGPSLDFLKKKGQGTMFELCVEVDNIEEFYDEMKNRDITLVDPAGRPLPSEMKYCSIPGDDNRYAYLPTEKTFGTTIEILERNTWTRETYWDKEKA